MTNGQRNDLVAGRVNQLVQDGHRVTVVTGQVDHAERLSKLINRSVWIDSTDFEESVLRDRSVSAVVSNYHRLMGYDLSGFSHLVLTVPMLTSYTMRNLIAESWSQRRRANLESVVVMVEDRSIGSSFERCVPAGPTS